MVEKLLYEVSIEPHPLWEAAHFEGQQLVGRFVCAGDAQSFARTKASGLLIATVVDRRLRKTLYRSEEPVGGGAPNAPAARSRDAGTVARTAATPASMLAVSGRGGTQT